MRLKEYIEAGHHKAHRREVCFEGFAASLSGLEPRERMTRRFEMLCGLEEPVLLPGEQIVFLRTVTTVPDCFTPAEWEAIRKTHFIHELGYQSNLAPNYGRVIAQGLEAVKETADPWGKRMIDALLDLTARYEKAAREAGQEALAQVLARVPRYGARSFREALQAFRILHFGLWLEGNYHVTVGRVDQYMWPWLEADLACGRLDEAGALALLEDFFLSFNKDSDLYPGVQQGDNGQSLMLGGNGSFHLLSRLCLEASANNRMIDPKINLRVDSTTPLDIFILGTRLTKAGLGFPQYSNDDVVIPGLVALGYDPEDAKNYTVAACWEFIIPGVGRDVANIGALSFPKVIDTCLRRDLPDCRSMETFLQAVEREIRRSCQAICDGIKDLWFVPSPLMALMLDEAKYHNFGIHGTGIATAADSLAAIEQLIFTEKSLTAGDLIRAVDRDFADDTALLQRLRQQMPKMGCGQSRADALAATLLEAFADSLAGRKNCLGGIYRAGTGSAMYYLWHADELGASPDGRRKGEPFGANFSPSLFAPVSGPLSAIRSFCMPQLSKAINGGPLTLEFSPTVFRTEESLAKVAALVQLYIRQGGHQLQLNTVDAEALQEAQKDPQRYRHLVVRIWGWSARFVELDPEYQDHVLRRHRYRM